MYISSFPASREYVLLNDLDPDQVCHCVGLDLDKKCNLMIFLKDLPSLLNSDL